MRASSASGALTADFTAAGTTGTGHSVVIVSGNSQVITANTVSGRGGPEQPLVVRVIDETGMPVPGATVTWGGQWVIGVSPSRTTTTDAAGLATVWVTVDNYSYGPKGVTATLSDGTSSAEFTVYVRGCRCGIVGAIVSGGGQTGRVGTELPVPIVTHCFDRSGEPQDVCGASTSLHASGQVFGHVRPAPGRYPRGQRAYYWTLGPQVGTQYFFVTAPQGPNHTTATATP